MGDTWEKPFTKKLKTLAPFQRGLVGFLVERHFTALQKNVKLGPDERYTLRRAMDEALEIAESCQTTQQAEGVRESYTPVPVPHVVAYSYSHVYSAPHDEGGGNSGLRDRPTHCKYGHPLTEGNFTLSEKGWRKCKICWDAQRGTVCKRGHDRSENTEVNNRGKSFCKICVRDKDAERRKRYKTLQKELREKSVDRVLGMGAD